MVKKLIRKINHNRQHIKKNKHCPDKKVTTEIIDGQYIRFKKILGSGLHGYVYDGIYNDTKIAIKEELDTSHEMRFYQEIQNNLLGYKSLITEPGYPGITIPNIFYSDSKMIIIEQYIKIASLNLSILDVLYMSIQLLDILKYYHSLNIIHRDIKPGNTLYKNGRFYIIDFSISCFTHEKCGRGGTYIYMSQNAHKSGRPSHMDDLISYAYTIIHLIKELPWAKQDKNNILSVKRSFKLSNFAYVFGCKQCKPCNRIAIMYKFLHQIAHFNGDYDSLCNLLLDAIKVHDTVNFPHLIY